MRSPLAWMSYGIGPRVGSAVRKRWTMLRNPASDIRFERGVFVGRGTKFYMPLGGSLIVREDARIGRRFRADIGAEAQLTIGRGAVIGNNVVISCDTSIEIGAGAQIGPGSYLVDGNHEFRDPDKFLLEQGYNYRPLRIGGGAYVAAKCTLVHNVGAGAFVGPNSIVNREVPDGASVVGVPAKPTG